MLVARSRRPATSASWPQATGCKVLALRQGANAAGLAALDLEAVDAEPPWPTARRPCCWATRPAGLKRPQAFFAAQSVAKAAKVEADLVLPRTHYLDDAGTVLTTDGRLGELVPARKRPANWELLSELAAQLGLEVDLAAVTAEARELTV